MMIASSCVWLPGDAWAAGLWQGWEQVVNRASLEHSCAKVSLLLVSTVCKTGKGDRRVQAGRGNGQGLSRADPPGRREDGRAGCCRRLLARRVDSCAHHHAGRSLLPLPVPARYCVHRVMHRGIGGGRGGRGGRRQEPSARPHESGKRLILGACTD